MSGLKVDGAPEAVFFSLSIDGGEDKWASCRLEGFDTDGGGSMGAMASEAITVLFCL